MSEIKQNCDLTDELVGRRLPRHEEEQPTGENEHSLTECRRGFLRTLCYATTITKEDFPYWYLWNATFFTLKL